MNKIDEYKNKINWDIWEDIQRVEENAEDDPYGETSPQVILERVKKLSGNTKSVIGSAISA